MDFFESQDRARRKTSALVGYYILAVFMILLSVYLVVTLLFAVSTTESSADSGAQESSFEPSQLWNPELFVVVMAGMLLIIGGGTAYKVMSLSGGGESVASLLGGRKINRDTGDANEKKVLNVVEEMAIASGIPVPPVFILENEQGINAFAAGFKPDTAVIGVTKGAVQTLSRDELQGVIAHEFSHIFNGDMRLNIKLMGVLHGILLISLVGFWIMRSSMMSGRSRSSKEKSGAHFALLGLALMIIGYIGVFFGKLIKSAVSRQREFLADASAVQFTRNPDGIAGALKKIGGFKSGSSLASVHAEEASHLFFSNGLKSSLLSLMSTHPPLTERIKRLDPSFSGDFSGKTGGSGKSGSESAMGFAGGGHVKVAPENVVSSIGAPDAAHLNYAAGMIAAIPDRLNTAAHDQAGAQGVIFNLLLSSDEKIRSAQMKALQALPDIHKKTTELEPLCSALKDELRLPLADIAIATLWDISKEQYKVLKKTVENLIVADNQVNLFEYTLNRLIIRHLDPHFEKTRPAPVKYHDVKPIAEKCAAVLSCIAYWGTSSEDEARQVFTKGIEKLGLDIHPQIRSQAECTLSLLDESLTALAAATPTVKKKVMDACVSCVAANNTVTVTESQTLRAIGDYLGCPVPPILATR